mmetsp:Transcript_86480/g.242068  ORF Transcript_86480/g.242068 Transcript_86480/m.242068 type:complete len:380 (-) Transcript_86480:71-1210(-)
MERSLASGHASAILLLLDVLRHALLLPRVRARAHGGGAAESFHLDIHHLRPRDDLGFRRAGHWRSLRARRAGRPPGWHRSRRGHRGSLHVHPCLRDTGGALLRIGARTGRDSRGAAPLPSQSTLPLVHCRGLQLLVRGRSAHHGYALLHFGACCHRQPFLARGLRDDRSRLLPLLLPGEPSGIMFRQEAHNSRLAGDLKHGFRCDILLGLAADSTLGADLRARRGGRHAVGCPGDPSHCDPRRHRRARQPEIRAEPGRHVLRSSCTLEQTRAELWHHAFRVPDELRQRRRRRPRHSPVWARGARARPGVLGGLLILRRGRGGGGTLAVARCRRCGGRPPGRVHGETFGAVGAAERGLRQRSFAERAGRRRRTSGLLAAA